MLINDLDITPKNVLLPFRGIDMWSTVKGYEQLERPIKKDVFIVSGGKPKDCAPEYLVEPLSSSHVDSHYISPQALLLDLGETFAIPCCQYMASAHQYPTARRNYR